MSVLQQMASRIVARVNSGSNHGNAWKNVLMKKIPTTDNISVRSLNYQKQLGPPIYSIWLSDAIKTLKSKILWLDIAGNIPEGESTDQSYKCLKKRTYSDVTIFPFFVRRSQSLATKITAPTVSSSSESQWSQNHLFLQFRFIPLNYLYDNSVH